MKEIWDKNKRALIMIFVIAGLILYNVYLFKVSYDASRARDIAQHNLDVALDTIRLRENRDKVIYEKLAYLTDNNTSLAKMNKELANEVKTIGGKVSTIIKTQIKILEKPIYVPVEGEILDSQVIARFKYDSTYSPGNFRRLSGYTSYNLKDGVVVAKKEVDEIGIKFTTGIKDIDKGKPEIFLTSDYPGFKVTQLDGAIIDPKLFEPKVRVPLITPTIAIGYTPVLYSPSNKQITLENRFGITIGLGFNVGKMLRLYK